MQSARAAFLFALLSLAAAPGCGNTTSSDAIPAAGGTETEGELRSEQLLENVRAVRIQIAHATPSVDVTVGLSAKVARIMAGIKKRPDGEEVRPTCMGSSRVTVRFFDEMAKEIATIDGFPAQGHRICSSALLDVNGKPPIAVGTDLDFVALADEPLVPGDALWGIDAVDISMPAGGSDKHVDNKDSIKKIVAAIRGDQKIDSARPMARCMPTYSVSFKRGEQEAAIASFLCDGAEESSVIANFAIIGGDGDPVTHGVVDLDPRPFRDLH